MSEIRNITMTTHNSMLCRLRIFLCNLGMLLIELGGMGVSVGGDTALGARASAMREAYVWGP